MKVKELVKSAKFWVISLSMLCGASVVLASYVVLPERVEECETKIEEVEVESDDTCNKVELMAQRIDDYVVAQEKVEKERDKRYDQQMQHQNKQNDMMWKVLDRVTK